MHALIDVILKPTNKSYKSHYISNWAFARALTSDQKIDQRNQINNFPRIHSDVYQCTFRCTLGELFLWTLWSTFRYTSGMKVKQGYVTYVSLWIPLIWGVKVLHIVITYIVKFILCMKYNIWHFVLYKEHPQTYTLLCIKIIVHVSFDCSIRAYDCSIRVYWSICTWCGEYISAWVLYL